MAKCDCYFQHGLKFLCYGTKEMEECSCGGDKSKCDFYPEKRQQKPKAKRQIVDVQEAKTFIDANWPNDPLLKQIVFNLLDKLPKVDTVEVVRCKDCEYWHELNGKDSGKPVGYGDCLNPCGINGIAYEDSFCSYRERKGDGIA